MSSIPAVGTQNIFEMFSGIISHPGKVKTIEKEKNSRIFEIQIPKNLGRCIAQKGSIAVNGVSLTVIRVRPSSFTVGIIPYTWKNTNFHALKTGDPVNIEVDILAKYVERLIKKSSQS